MIAVPPVRATFFNFDRVLGIGGGVVGLFGLILTWYSIKRSEKSRKPTFSIETPRLVAINRGMFAYKGFSILHNGEAIATKENVVSMVIRFWNSGSLPILENEIQNPFRITLPAGCTLLDSFISSTTRPEIQATLESVAATEGDSVVVKAHVLEPNDGMNIALLYCGDVTTTVKFSGSCLEAHTPLVLQGDLVQDFPISVTWSKVRKTFQPVLLMIMLVTLINFVGNYKGRGSSYVFWSFMGVLIFMSFLALCAIVYALTRTKRLPTPLMRK